MVMALTRVPKRIPRGLRHRPTTGYGPGQNYRRSAADRGVYTRLKRTRLGLNYPEPRIIHPNSVQPNGNYSREPTTGLLLSGSSLCDNGSPEGSRVSIGRRSGTCERGRRIYSQGEY